MNAHRFLFYCPDATADSAEIYLEDAEHHHFARVLRRGAGDGLYVTNGLGLLSEYEAADVEKERTRATLKQVHTDHPPPAQLILALGMIRKERFEQAFEQCVELGITGCIPFRSANTQIKGGYAKQYLERLNKIAVTAMKQSFRSWLPRVVEPVSFDSLVSMANRTRRVVVGEAGADRATQREPLENTMVVVGPEAGLEFAELRALKYAGAKTAAVTSGRLRSETAAVALIAAMAGRD